MTTIINPSTLMNSERNQFEDDWLHSTTYEEVAGEEKIEEIEIKTPMEIAAILDEYVIGQTQTKKRLAVAAYNHLLRIANNFSDDSPEEIEKSNVIMVGPTGSGKTLLAEALAAAINVPFHRVAVTDLSESGYVGKDVQTILQGLIRKHSVAQAERGIIFLDEIDKLARNGESVSTTKDVSGEGVQNELLTIIEGAEVTVPGGQRLHPNEPGVTINTKNILFITGGAFCGITKQKGQSGAGKGIGFNADVRENSGASDYSGITPDDLIKYGLKPEFVGRLPVISPLHTPTLEEIIRILTEPKKNIIKQYQRLFATMGKTRVFEAEAIVWLAEKAMGASTGTRYLRSLLEKTMLELQFSAPDSEQQVFNVTRELLAENF